MKRILILGAILSFVVFAVLPAQAERIFAESFQKTFGLSRLENDLVSQTVIGDTIYYLLRNGSLYTWQPGQNSYALMTKVKSAPLWNIERPLSQQGQELETEILESVDCLVPSEEGALYGFNLHSGLIGKIDQNGWHLNDTRLDVSGLTPPDQYYPEDIFPCFIAGARMYGMMDLYASRGKSAPDTSLLVFDLSDGVCTSIKMPDVLAFCSYTPGKLLCVKDNGSTIPTLAVYDITTRQTVDHGASFPVSIPRKSFKTAFELRSHFGGFAYNRANNAIYVTDEKGPWRSLSGGPFERIPTTEKWETLSLNPRAWTLSSGGYVTLNEWCFYFR